MKLIYCASLKTEYELHRETIYLPQSYKISVFKGICALNRKYIYLLHIYSSLYLNLKVISNIVYFQTYQNSRFSNAWTFPLSWTCQFWQESLHVNCLKFGQHSIIPKVTISVNSLNKHLVWIQCTNNKINPSCIAYAEDTMTLVEINMIFLKL